RLSGATTPRPRHRVAVERGPLEADEADLTDRRQPGEAALDLAERDVARICGGEAVGASADRREGDGLDRMPLGERQAGAVAAGQERVLAAPPALPYRAYGMDHPLGWEAVSARDPRLARRTAAERAALLEQTRARGAVNRAVHATAAEQRLVGGVHDGVHGQARDVALQDPHAPRRVIGSPPLRPTAWSRCDHSPAPLMEVGSGAGRTGGGCNETWRPRGDRLDRRGRAGGRGSRGAGLHNIRRAGRHAAG